MTTARRVGSGYGFAALLAPFGFLALACATPVDDGGANPAAPGNETPPTVAGNPSAHEANGLGPATGGAPGTGGATGSGGDSGSTGSGGAAGDAGATGVGGNGGNPVTEPGLVGFWSFEDTGKTIVDASGQGHNGTLLGVGASLAASGKVGSALDLSGTDGRMVVPGTSQLDFASGGTIEFWVRLNSVSTGAILTRVSASGDGLRVRSTQGNLQITFSHGGSNSSLTSDPDAIGSSWAHVAIVNDGSELMLYVDGRLQKSVAGGQMGYVGADLSIGKGGTDNSIDGFIDEVKWYTLARAAADVCSDAGAVWSGTDCQ